MKLKDALAEVEARRGAFISMHPLGGRRALIPYHDKNLIRRVRSIDLAHVGPLKLRDRMQDRGYSRYVQQGGCEIWRPSYH